MSVLLQIALYTYFLPLIFFLLFCLKKSKIGLKVVFFYILLEITTDIISTKFAWGRNNLYLIQSIFTLIEYVSISLFLYLSLSNPLFKKIILIASFFFILYCIYSLIKTDPTKFDSIPSSLENILIIIYCIMYMFEQISNPKIGFIYASPNFWIVLAFLVYTSATLFLYISTSSLSENEKNKFWIINHISNIITNVFLAIGFMMNKNYKEDEADSDENYFNTTL